MTQLKYQPVSAPDLGNAASTIVDAGRGISEGFTAIGAGLTRLGERREARQKEEYNRKQTALLEAIGLEAATITDENQLNILARSLASVQAGGPAAVGTPATTAEAESQGKQPNTAAPGYGGPIGAAALIAGRRDNIIDQNKSRADTAGVLADTAGKEVTTKTAQNLLDQTLLGQQFQNEEQATISEITRLALSGDHQGAMRLGTELSARAGGKYGADIVDPVLRGIFTDLGTGDDALTKVLTNATSVKQGEATLDLTNAQTENTYASADSARASAANTRQDTKIDEYNWTQDIAADKIAEAERVEGKAIDASAARILQSFTEPEDAYLAADKENLSETARLILKDTLTAKMVPGWQDIYQSMGPYPETPDRNYRPEDAFLTGARPLSEAPFKQIGGVKIPLVGRTNSQLDVPRVVDIITGNTQQLIESSDETLALYGDVVKREAQLGAGTTNLQQMLVEEYGGSFRNEADTNKFYEQVRIVQNGINSKEPNARRLTDAEMMAIVDRSLKKRGANFPGSMMKGAGVPFIPGFNLLPGNERSDQFTVMGDEMRAVADSYRKQDVGEMRGRYSGYMENVTRANYLEKRITDLEESRARAIAKNDDKAKTRYDGLLTDALDELAGINKTIEETITAPKGKKK